MVTINRQKAASTHHRKMTLLDLLDRYMAAVAVGPRYAESLRRTCRKADDSGLKSVRQLSPDLVNKFLCSLPLSPTTRHNIRRELLTLWRFAFDSNLTNTPPLRVRKIAASYSPPQAWALTDLVKMLEVAERDQTRISRRVRVTRGDLLPAWIQIAYDTGLRFADVHALTAHNIRNGCVCMTAQKTGKPLVRKLSPQTLAAVQHLLDFSPDGTLFKWALPRRRAFLLWRTFLDKHKFYGSSKWFRRACATQKHLAERGSASEYLQHSDPRLVARHYLDQTQADVPQPPPPIRGGSRISNSTPAGIC